MKKVLLCFVLLGSVFVTSCSDEKDTQEQERVNKEAQLNLKIKEADRLFKKYGWENDPEIDRSSKEFKEEYEKMDLKQLEGFLKQMKEGIKYDDTIVTQKYKPLSFSLYNNDFTSYITGQHSFEFGSSRSRIDFKYNFTTVTVTGSSAEISVPIVSATYTHKSGSTSNFNGNTANVEANGEVKYGGNKRASVMKGTVNKSGNGSVNSFRV